MKKAIQLSDIINTHSTKAILKDTKKFFCCHYSKKSYSKIKKVYFTIKDLFEGRFPGYQKCNTEYHDFEHTIEAFQASLRILDGYNIVNEKFPEDLARCLLIATLFHDAGYIMEEHDTSGTGAKYTINHVERSIDFLKNHYEEFYINNVDVEIIASIIHGTKFILDFDSIQFMHPLHKIAGAIVSSADLLGQMSNRYYLEKLLFLYYEFREANIPDFSSEYDLIKKTVGFYNMAMEKISDKFMNVHEYVQSHFKTRYNIDQNLYIESIEKQMAYLYQIIEDDSTNFRHKLKRNEKFQIVKDKPLNLTQAHRN